MSKRKENIDYLISHNKKVLNKDRGEKVTQNNNNNSDRNANEERPNNFNTEFGYEDLLNYAKRRDWNRANRDEENNDF